MWSSFQFHVVALLSLLFLSQPPGLPSLPFMPSSLPPQGHCKGNFSLLLEIFLHPTSFLAHSTKELLPQRSSPVWGRFHVIYIDKTIYLLAITEKSQKKPLQVTVV